MSVSVAFDERGPRARAHAGALTADLRARGWCDTDIANFEGTFWGEVFKNLERAYDMVPQYKALSGFAQQFGNDTEGRTR